MIWFIVGVLIGHYVIPDVKTFIEKRRDQS